MKLSIDEQETHIYFDVVNKVWTADTSYPPHIRRFTNKGWKRIKEQFYPDGTLQSVIFASESKKGITITNPNGSRSMTEEQKEKARQRMLEYHQNKIDDDEDDDIEDIDLDLD